MHTLGLVRHAKADSPPGVPDVDRPLRGRGIGDAGVAGAWLRSTVGRPDLLVCSPARRTAQTAVGLLAAYGEHDAPEIRYCRRIYEATVEALLTVVAGLDDAADPVFLVGHNPSISALVGRLTGVPTQLRTCGIAVLQMESTWAAAGVATGRLVASTTARAG